MYLPGMTPGECIKIDYQKYKKVFWPLVPCQILKIKDRLVFLRQSLILFRIKAPVGVFCTIICLAAHIFYPGEDV